jgi:hypothetical protein
MNTFFFLTIREICTLSHPQIILILAHMICSILDVLWVYPPKVHGWKHGPQCEDVKRWWYPHKVEPDWRLLDHWTSEGLSVAPCGLFSHMRAPLYHVGSSVPSVIQTICLHIAFHDDYPSPSFLPHLPYLFHRLYPGVFLVPGLQ